MRRGKHTSRKASNGGAGASLDDDEAYEAFLVQLENDPDSVSGAGRSRKDRRTMASRLVDSAVDSPDAMRALGYALRAVRLDPWHLDARVLLALAAKGPQSELIEELRTIVAAGEADLGPEFFRENRGRFWGVMESRPLHARPLHACTGTLSF